MMAIALSPPHAAVVPPPEYKDVVALFIYPLEDSASIDMKFLLKNYEDLGPKWSLIDPLGNSHKVCFNMNMRNPLLTKGWFNISSFYFLQGVHYCVMNFLGESMFHIKIYDQLDKEISYAIIPPPAITFENLVAEAPLPPFPILPNPVDYYRISFTVKLTYYKARGSQLNLPRSVGYYLRKWGLDPWILIGPSGIEYPINIIAPANRLYSKFGKGWRVFITMNDIMTGDIVTFNFTDGLVRKILAVVS